MKNMNLLALIEKKLLFLLKKKANSKQIMKEYLKIQMRIPKNEHLADYISNYYRWLINHNANLLFIRKEKESSKRRTR